MAVNKVLMFSPEYYGHVMVGGLAMAVHGLSRALVRKGLDVRVAIPEYTKRGSDNTFDSDEQNKSSVPYIVDGVDVGVYRVPSKFVFPETYSKPAIHIEDWAYRRMTEKAFNAATLFSQSVPTVIDHFKNEGWVPDIFHLHEWPMSASAKVLSESRYGNLPRVVTFHNGKFIGEVPQPEESVGADRQYLKQTSRVINVGDEYFGSLLEMGIHFSDAVNTVSPTYAEEILSGEVDRKVLKRLRERNLEGILNGLDTNVFDSRSDRYIVKFNPNDMESVAYGKGSNKLALHKKYNINAHDVMQISLMARLEDQKGIDVLLKAANDLANIEGVHILVVGTSSDHRIRDEVLSLRGNMTGNSYFVGPKEQHLILAGSDAILMPSRFEPFGYTHLEGMRYGALPIVRPVGGLKDTVEEIDGDKGYGIMIKNLDVPSLVQAIKDARDIYNNLERRRVAIGNALKADFSWDGHKNPVGKYIELYSSAVAKSKSRKVSG